MDHPEITTIERTGYPSWMQEPEVIGVDSLGNEIYEDEKIYVLNDEVFVYEELTYNAIEVLEKLGATLTYAK